MYAPASHSVRAFWLNQSKGPITADVFATHVRAGAGLAAAGAAAASGALPHRHCTLSAASAGHAKDAAPPTAAMKPATAGAAPPLGTVTLGFA